MPPAKFFERVDEWAGRVKHSEFIHCDYRDTMKLAERGDVVYCDPPYVDSQKILYGAQSFKLSELFLEIEKCRSRGVHVALSIDGSKKLGDKLCELAIPQDLFKREELVNCGRSMLKRFQMSGLSLENQGCSTLKALISQNSIEAKGIVIQTKTDVFHAVEA